MDRFRTFTVARGNFVGTGNATGPVILGGIRVPVGGGAVGGEIRYQSAKGDLPTDQGFSGTKIDLGGLTLQVRRLEHDHITGTIGDGSGRLSVETGSGNVRLQKL